MFLCSLSGRDTCCLSRWDKVTMGRTARSCRAGRDLTTHTAASQLTREKKGRYLVWTWLTMKTTTATQKWWVPAVFSWQRWKLFAFASRVHVWSVDKLDNGASWWQQTLLWGEREKQKVNKRGQKINWKDVGVAIRCLLVERHLDFAFPACEWFGFWTEKWTSRERR